MAMKRGLYIVLAVLVALFMTGCMGESGKTTSTDAKSTTSSENTTAASSSDNNSGTDATNGARKLKIVSTVFPGYDMVRAIAGDLVENSLLVPVGADSHTYEPTPQDMKLIMDADILIITGGENDVWVKELMHAEGKKPIIVPMMKYSPILVFGMGHYHENPNGELYDDLMADHDHDHDHGHGHEGHNHGDHDHGSESTTAASQTASGAEGTTGTSEAATGSGEGDGHEGEGEGHEGEGDGHEGEGEGHDHGHGNEGHDHGHDHDHDHTHHHHHHHEVDEHVWTSPMTYIAIAKAVSQVIIEKELAVSAEMMKAGNEAASNAHFENTKTYATNIAALEKAVDELIDQYAEMRKVAKRDAIVMADRFPFGYLATTYEFGAYAAFEGCSEDNDVDPSAVASLIEVVKRDSIPVVLKLKVSDGKIAKTIAEETGAKILSMQDGHVISPEDWEAGKTYVEMMKENLEVLREALGANE